MARLGPPKRQRDSVAQLYKHIATRRQIELIHVVEINDRVPMHAQKTVCGSSTVWKLFMLWRSRWDVAPIWSEYFSRCSTGRRSELEQFSNERHPTQSRGARPQVA